MLSSKQCELAKVFTGTNVQDEIIIVEYDKLDSQSKKAMCGEVHLLIKLHNAAFDKAFSMIKNDFMAIADKYMINPATLFCAYMSIAKDLS